jgi:hypothetical protein
VQGGSGFIDPPVFVPLVPLEAPLTPDAPPEEPPTPEAPPVPEEPPVGPEPVESSPELQPTAQNAVARAPAITELERRRILVVRRSRRFAITKSSIFPRGRFRDGRRRLAAKDVAVVSSPAPGTRFL